MPYRDWVEQKPPATLGMHAVAQAAFKDGVRGLRWVSLLWTAVTVLGLGLFTLQLLGLPSRLSAWDDRRRAWTALAAGLFAALLLSSARTQSLSANTESWLSLPLLAAFSLAFARDASPSFGRWTAIGAWIGLASLFKQPAAAALLFVPWAAAERPGRLLHSMAACVLGAALVWSLALLVFAWQGAGGDFLFDTLAYNRGYVLSTWSHWKPAMRSALGLGLALLPELGAFMLVAFLGLRALGAGRPRRALLAWSATGLTLFAVSGRFYPHYTIGLLAPLALLAGFGLMAPSWSRRGHAVRLLLLAAMLLPWAWANAPLWRSGSGAERSVRLYGTPLFAQAPRAAELIRALAPEGSKVFQWGDEAELFYLARRVPASRFLYSFPFSGEAPAWPDGDNELLAALRAPSTGAVVLAKPLDPSDRLQASVAEGLQELYRPDPSVRPYVIGGRLP